MMSKEFVSEVNQELHDERMVGLWKRFGKYIIGGAVGVVAVTALNKGYHSYTDTVAKEEALAFENALKGDLMQLGKLSLNGNEGSKLLSTMTLAQSYVNKGDSGKATQILLTYADHVGEDIYENYARLASVWVRMQLQSNNTESLLPVLDRVIASGHYKNLALFSKVEILLGLGNKVEAKKILLEISLDPTMTAQQHEMARIALSTLAGQ